MISIKIGILVVLCYKVYSNTFPFWRKVQDSIPLLRIPLLIFDVWDFLEETLKLLTNILSLSIARYLLRFSLPFDPPITSTVSTLVDGLLFPPALVWMVSFVYFSSQKFPCFLRALKLSEGLICTCKQCPGKSYPCLLVLFFNYKEGILGYISWSPPGLLW